MTLDDLDEQGVLLPEEEWGEHPLETTAPEVPLLAAFLAAVTGCVLMYVGAGGPLTGVGTVLFLAALYGMTWMCDRAILRQRERVRERRGGRRPAGRSEADGGAADAGAAPGEAAPPADGGDRGEPGAEGGPR